jgi:hypothetical protein
MKSSTPMAEGKCFKMVENLRRCKQTTAAGHGIDQKLWGRGNLNAGLMVGGLEVDVEG